MKGKMVSMGSMKKNIEQFLKQGATNDLYCWIPFLLQLFFQSAVFLRFLIYESVRTSIIDLVKEKAFSAE